MATIRPIPTRPAPAAPQRPVEPAAPVLRSGSPPAQRVLPLRRAA
jgi:hypothetical protein